VGGKDVAKEVPVIETKTSFTYKQLKEEIFNGHLKPGEKLVASKIAEDFGISIIPVREAFGQLKAEGYVTIVPHTGVYVAEINFDQLRKIYALRAVLEGYAVRLAASKLKSKDLDHLSKIITKIDRTIESEKFTEIDMLNYHFHMSIYEASGNEYLVKLIDDLLEKTTRVRKMYGLMPERAVMSNHEHRRILEALEKKNVERAEQLVRLHLDKTLKALSRSLSPNPSDGHED
jgi:DNA-binding GntR family transcriptional regulator